MDDNDRSIEDYRLVRKTDPEAMRRALEEFNIVVQRVLDETGMTEGELADLLDLNKPFPYPEEGPTPETMDRLDLTRRVLAHLTDEAVFAGIGNAGFDLFAAGDRPQNFYMFGSMGLASSLGLGYALSRPTERVVVLEGEGSVLMNLGSLATIARMRPRRYLLIIMDNGTYALTGSQPNAAAEGADLAMIARGAGIPHVAAPETPEGFERAVVDALAADGPAVIVVRIADGNSAVRHGWDPVQLKHRFMAGVAR